MASMKRRAVFIPYQPKTILNKSKRADHWFWTRYSAYPYLGCQHGCEFCYCRERKFSPYDDPDDFAYVIKVKENAASLLRQALSKASMDAVFTGDYQPAEKRFQLSRRMLEVCLELGFPVFVLERSPLVLRDLDLLQALQGRARVTVAFSIIYTPESPHSAALRRIERLAPLPEKRFAAMARLAAAGITTGVCAMPLLPGLCDDPANLEAIVRWTAEHGGQFVLASSLTLSDQQRDYFMHFLNETMPHLLGLYQRLYPKDSYNSAGYQWGDIARQVRDLCGRYGIVDRMPRPIIPGEKLAFNKRIVERLANHAYTLELEDATTYKVWAYRKAAWAIEDLEQDIRLVYQAMGEAGLRRIPGVGAVLAGEIGRWLREASRL